MKNDSLHFTFLFIVLLGMSLSGIMGLWVFAVQLPAFALMVYFGLPKKEK